MEEADRRLVDRAVKGDRQAFGVLVGKYQKPVFNIALRMTRSYADAQDIAQATFLKAFEKLESYNEQYKFFSWLYRIAVNESLNFVRYRVPQQETDLNIASDEPSPLERSEEENLVSMIEASLLDLKVEHRTVIVLKHLQGLSYSEISEILDLPGKTVKSRLFTARQVLKEILIKKGVRIHDS
jgi:RNA polymerase sigma-70 factor (ECF subfamily)